jgi:predicted ribosomally synthesized peptide with SipW-like signal peptide
MNKKLIYSLSLVILIVVAATLGTLAFFTATQTIEQSTFIAGTLDLDVRGGSIKNDSINVFNFGYHGLISGEKSWKIVNVGNLNGRLYIDLEDIENINRGCNGPKMIARGYYDVDDISEVEKCNNEPGRLGEFIVLTLYINDEELISTNLISGQEDLFKEEWQKINPIILSPSEEKIFTISWLAESINNEVQNDELKFDIKFHLTQNLN